MEHRCQDITYENHKVSIAGVGLSEAKAMGLSLDITPRRFGNATGFTGRVDRELFDKIMRDPNHRFHPHPCTCKD